MKKISIFIQAALVIFIAFAIPATIIIYTNSRLIQVEYEKIITESAVNRLNEKRNLSDEMISSIIYSALDLITEKEYINLNNVISYDYLNTSSNYINTSFKIKNKLNYMGERNRLIESSFFYLNNADYIISDNYGLIKLKSFEDIDWFYDAKKKINSIEGLWYPHKTTNNENIISYLYSSNNLSTPTKAIVSINLYEDELSELIYPAQEAIDGYGFLIDSSGNIISSSDKDLLYKNIDNNEYIHNIINFNKSNGYNVTDDQKYIYIYEKSDLYDWTYVNVLSLNSVFEKSNQVTRLGIIYTAIITFIGAIFAVYLLFGLFKPLKKITKEMRLYSPNLKKFNGNEISYLTGAFGDIKAREAYLKNSLLESKKSAEITALDKLIKGDIKSDDLKLLKEKILYNHYIVCILSIDNFISYQNNTSHEIRRKHRLFMYDCAQKVFNEKYIIRSTRYNVSSIAILINIEKYDSLEVRKNIKDALNKFKIEYFNKTNQTLSIGVSGVHSGMENVIICVDEAYFTLNKRLILGSSSFVFFGDNKNIKREVYNSYEHEKRITNYLKTKNINKISEELEIMIIEIRKIQNISVENVMLVFNQLIGSILMYMNKNNYDIDLLFGSMQSSFYVDLSEIETIDGMKVYIEKICLIIIQYQEESGSEDNLDYSKKISKYINENYKSDIDFELLAKDIGISYSYLRKIIKLSTGKNLTDNINLLRINEAKRLLQKNELTISQIADEVGYHNVQSLNRFFKKFEGITPSEYRKPNNS